MIRVFYLYGVCKNANIVYDTFLEWIEKYPEFSEAVKKAENYGNDKIKDICKRRIIENDSWQSAAWWLERNYKEEYSLKQEFDHTTKGESINQQPDLSKLTKEEIKVMAAINRKLRE